MNLPQLIINLSFIIFLALIMLTSCEDYNYYSIESGYIPITESVICYDNKGVSYKYNIDGATHLQNNYFHFYYVVGVKNERSRTIFKIDKSYFICNAN